MSVRGGFEKEKVVLYPEDRHTEILSLIAASNANALSETEMIPETVSARAEIFLNLSQSFLAIIDGASKGSTKIEYYQNEPRQKLAEETLKGNHIDLKIPNLHTRGLAELAKDRQNMVWYRVSRRIGHVGE